MNHIQWLSLDPARSSASAISKTPSWASMKRWRLCGSEGATPRQCAWHRRRGRGSWRLLVRRQQPRHEIEEDHYWARQQRGRDEGEPDHGWVNAGVVGKS